MGHLTLETAPGAPVEVLFEPLQPDEAYRLHLAVLGFGISSSIGGGENSGRVLEEDFVLLGLRDGEAQAGKALRWSLPRPEAGVAETERRALVAWVSRDDDPTPGQAVGGWLVE